MKKITVGDRNYTIKAAPAIYLRRITVYLAAALTELGGIGISDLTGDQGSEMARLQQFIDTHPFRVLEEQAYDAFEAILEEEYIHFLISNKGHNIINLSLSESLELLAAVGEMTTSMGEEVAASKKTEAAISNRQKGFQPKEDGKNSTGGDDALAKLKRELAEAKRQINELTIPEN